MKRSRPKKKIKAQTFIRLGRKLRVGGVTTVKYTRGLLSRFNDYTSREDATGGALGRIRLTFPRFIALTLLVIVLAVMLFDNQSVNVEQVTISVPGLHKDLEGYTILQLSDMHGLSFGTNQSMLLHAIDGLGYQMVVMTGDMVGSGGNAQPLYDLLGGLSSGKPVYFIAGDSDPGPLLNAPREVEGSLKQYVLQDWILGAESRGATYVDGPTSLKVGDATLWLTPDAQLNLNASLEMARMAVEVKAQQDGVIEGDPDAYNTLPFTEYRMSCLTRLSDAIKAMADGDLHIALAHYPATLGYINSAQSLSAKNSDSSVSYLRAVDLVLAGHYCGGQWKLPFIGAIYIPAPEAERHGWFPAQSEVEGLSLMGSTSMYISGGLGATDSIYLPRFRLLNSPKVTLITLTASLTEDMLN